MSDLVERINGWLYGDIEVISTSSALMREAAEEIERLRAELAVASQLHKADYVQLLVAQELTKRLRADVEALYALLHRLGGILRGTEDEDQGAAYDRAQRVIDAALRGKEPT